MNAFTNTDGGLSLRQTLLLDIAAFGNHAAFIANVIEAQGFRKPMTKLRGLLTLLRAGHTVSMAQFSIDDLVIDGRRYGMSVLESPKLVDTWRDVAPVMTYPEE